MVEEWDDVATITPKLNEPADYAAKTCTSLVTFQEAYDHFMKSDLTQHMVHTFTLILHEFWCLDCHFIFLSSSYFSEKYSTPY